MKVTAWAVALAWVYSLVPAGAATIDRPVKVDSSATPPVVEATSPRLHGYIRINAERAVDVEPTGNESLSYSSDTGKTGELLESTAGRGEVFESAFRMSEWIGICEFIGYHKGNDISYDKPPQAEYRLIKRLKGPPNTEKVIRVNFRFDCVTASNASRDWNFADEMMPPVGSRWIVFLPEAIPLPGRAFETYKGSSGRQAASDENLRLIYAILEAHHGQTDNGMGPYQRGPVDHSGALLPQEALSTVTASIQANPTLDNK